MSDSKKRCIDWDAIELEYRAGVRTVREIGAQFGVSHTAINKKAKASGWVRDLKARIRSKAEALVSRDAVATKVSMETEREIIEANAVLQANVIRAHRKDITRYRALCEMLLSEIELQTGERITFEQLGELMAAPDDKGQDKRNDLFCKVISTPSRVDSVKKLAETLKTLIGLERQAFGIADNADGNDPPPSDFPDADVIAQAVQDRFAKFDSQQ